MTEENCRFCGKVAYDEESWKGLSHPEEFTDEFMEAYFCQGHELEAKK